MFESQMTRGLKLMDQSLKEATNNIMSLQETTLQYVQV